MAIVKLQEPQWKYDTSTGELIMIFVESAPADEPDPANWQPPRMAEVRFAVPPGNVTLTILARSKVGSDNILLSIDEIATVTVL